MAEGDKADDSRSIVALAIFVEGGLIVVAWLLGWLFDAPPLDLFRWDALDALWGVAATLPMLVLFFACLRWPVGPLRPIRDFCDQVVRPLFAPCSLLDLAGIATLAGVGEEMVFRGVLQTAFDNYLKSPWAALLLASVVFGFCHAITVGYIVLATLLGAYLGGLFQLTGNLLPAIIAHSLYDFVALVVFVRWPRPPAPAQVG